MQLSPKMMFLELVISLVFWAVVFGIPSLILWRSRHWIGDKIIAALAMGEKARRQALSGMAALRRKVDERAG